MVIKIEVLPAKQIKGAQLQVKQEGLMLKLVVGINKPLQSQLRFTLWNHCVELTCDNDDGVGVLNPFVANVQLISTIKPLMTYHASGLL